MSFLGPHPLASLVALLICSLGQNSYPFLQLLPGATSQMFAMITAATLRWEFLGMHLDKYWAASPYGYHRGPCFKSAWHVCNFRKALPPRHAIMCSFQKIQRTLQISKGREAGTKSQLFYPTTISMYWGGGGSLRRSNLCFPNLRAIFISPKRSAAIFKHDFFQKKEVKFWLGHTC